MDKVSQHLLTIKTVFINPHNFFTFSSGLKSPLYCDNRLIYSFPKTRKFIAQAIAKKISQSFPNCQALVGVATAGIPLAILVGEILNLPVSYVRPKSKTYGRQNQIEGIINSRQKVVVIDDLITTGQSVFSAIEVLQKKQVIVLGVAAIFSYGFAQTQAKFAAKQIILKNLTNLNLIVKTALAMGKISNLEQKIIDNWVKKVDINNLNY